MALINALQRLNKLGHFLISINPRRKGFRGIRTEGCRVASKEPALISNRSIGPRFKKQSFPRGQEDRDSFSSHHVDVVDANQTVLHIARTGPEKPSPEWKPANVRAEWEQKTGSSVWGYRASI